MYFMMHDLLYFVHNLWFLLLFSPRCVILFFVVVMIAMATLWHMRIDSPQLLRWRFSSYSSSSALDGCTDGSCPFRVFQLRRRRRFDFRGPSIFFRKGKNSCSTLGGSQAWEICSIFSQLKSWAVWVSCASAYALQMRCPKLFAAQSISMCNKLRLRLYLKHVSNMFPDTM